MFQRISLYWLLSELSPVWMASASGAPLTGPRADPVDPAHHRLGDVGGEHLLRPVGRGGRTARWLSNAHRRLGVDDVDVAELGERQQRACAAAGAPACAGDAEVGADDVRLARRRGRRGRQPPGAGLADAGTSGRAWCRWVPACRPRPRPPGRSRRRRRLRRRWRRRRRRRSEEVATGELHEPDPRPADAQVRGTFRRPPGSRPPRRCRRGARAAAIARPAASACSSGHAGQRLGPVTPADQHHRRDRRSSA